MEVYVALSDTGYAESDKNTTFYFLQKTPKGAKSFYVDKFYKRYELQRLSNSNVDYIRKNSKKYSYAEMSKVLFRSIFSKRGIYSI